MIRDGASRPIKDKADSMMKQTSGEERYQRTLICQWAKNDGGLIGKYEGQEAAEPKSNTTRTLDPGTSLRCMMRYFPRACYLPLWSRVFGA